MMPVGSSQVNQSNSKDISGELLSALPHEIKAKVLEVDKEIELLLCCARTHIDTVIAERIENLLQEDINWGYLMRTASQQGIMPLLYSSLNNTCPEAVPQDTFSQLQRAYHTNALHNVLLTKELLKLLNLFKTQEIPAIPFKGPVLAASAYGSLSLREFGDLDILVHKQDVPKVKDLLISQSYEWQPWRSQSTHPQSSTYLQSQYRYDIYFIKWHSKNYRSCIEIHWETTPKHIMFPLNPAQLWQNLEQVSLCGTKVLNLPPEHLLPILCIDHSKDHWAQLRVICDVAELLRAYKGLDWQRVIEHANSLRRERSLFLGLFLAHDLLGTALPEEVWHKMQTDPVAKSLAMQVRERLFRDSDNQPGVWERFLYNLKLRESMQDKVRYCLFRATKLFEEQG
jgi:hypothetical protein